MKKSGLFLGLAAAVGLLFASTAAAYEKHLPEVKIKTEVVDCGAATVATYITPNNRLIGFYAGGAAATTATEVGLYDTDSANCTDKRLIAEVSWGTQYECSDQVIFPYPRAISEGVGVVGTSTNFVVLYYE